MAFPLPIPCPACGYKSSVHIYFRSFVCYRCNTMVPLTNEQYESCFRVIPADGKKSLIPPARVQEPSPEIAPASIPAFDRPFPLEMPKPEHKRANPAWSDIRFPGDFIRVFDYEVPLADTYDIGLLVRPDIGREDRPAAPDEEDAKDAFIRLLRAKCGRKA